MSFLHPPESVVLRDAQVLRHGLPLFAPINVDLPRGSALWLQGGNGSGKTSLLKLLAGAPLGMRGCVMADNKVINCQNRDWLTRVAYLGHRLGLHPTLTVGDNLRGLCADSAPATAALAALGLMRKIDIPVQYLSHGQQQRLAWVIWVLSARARIWLLDETFAALDDGVVARITQYCAAHRQAGGSIIFTAHQPVSGMDDADVLRLGAA